MKEEDDLAALKHLLQMAARMVAVLELMRDPVARLFALAMAKKLLLHQLAKRHDQETIRGFVADAEDLASRIAHDGNLGPGEVGMRDA